MLMFVVYALSTNNRTYWTMGKTLVLEQFQYATKALYFAE